MALSDSTGTIVQRYEYDSFGNRKDMQNTIKQPYTYTGREYDRETGLYYYRARYYDAMEGRFISKDPIGFAGGDVNLYNYVGGNPINYVDPSGLFNPTKALSATLNAVNAGRLYAGGALKLSAAAGFTGTGMGAPAGAGIGALGVWNLYSADKARERSLQQWSEALDEDWDNASLRNLLGVLPFGQNYDDPCEPTPQEFLMDKYNELSNNSNKLIDLLKELGTFAF